MDDPVTPNIAPTQAPWMNNEVWASGNIRDTSVQNLLSLWVITVVWNVAAIMGVRPCIQDAIHTHQALPLLALVFPMAGLGVFTWALRRTTRIVKFGDSILHLQTLPAVPGGNLAGTIHVSRAVCGIGKMELRLRCVAVEQNSKDRSEHLLWQQRLILDALPACPRGTDIPVLFDIPSTAQATSGIDQDAGIRWRLEARCQTRGVSYFSRFEVPVFAATPAEITAAAAAAEPVVVHRLVGATDPRRRLSERGIICQPLAGNGLRIHFAAARSKSGAMFPTGIGLVFTGIGVALALASTDLLFRIITWSFAAILLLIGLVMDYVAIYCWLASNEITVRHGWLTVENRLLLLHWQKTYTAKDISDISADDAGTWEITSDSGKTTKQVTYGIKLKTRNGKSTFISTDIFQKDYAAWLAEEIRYILDVGGAD